MLERVRPLTHLETSKEELLRIILPGQPELAENLRHKNRKQLTQRITARYRLNRLPTMETARGGARHTIGAPLSGGRRRQTAPYGTAMHLHWRKNVEACCQES